MLSVMACELLLLLNDAMHKSRVFILDQIQVFLLRLESLFCSMSRLLSSCAFMMRCIFLSGRSSRRRPTHRAFVSQGYFRLQLRRVRVRLVMLTWFLRREVYEYRRHLLSLGRVRFIKMRGHSAGWLHRIHFFLALWVLQLRNARVHLRLLLARFGLLLFKHILLNASGGLQSALLVSTLLLVLSNIQARFQ